MSFTNNTSRRTLSFFLLARRKHLPPISSSLRSCLLVSSFSTTTSKPPPAPSSGNDDDLPRPPVLCDVIQGPSLLRTPISRPNPSLLFLPGLRSLPFWTSEDYSRIAYGDPMVAHVVEHLESHASVIREEYQQVAPKIPSDYDNTDHNPTALHQGKEKWKWHSYLSKGNVQGNFVWQFPKTSAVLQTLRDEKLLFEGTPFGFSFFSTLAGGGSTISAHTAPMNLRLRIHLPLIVPSSSSSSSSSSNAVEEECGIRVGPIIRPWTQDKALVFDDSFDHEVWNHTSTTRVLLLVDIWHPDISPMEKQEIVKLFQTARQEGLWKR